MADIVLAIGTSHSPLLNSPAEDYPKHAAIDASGRKLHRQERQALHLWRPAGAGRSFDQAADRAQGAGGALGALHRQYRAAGEGPGRRQARRADHHRRRPARAVLRRQHAGDADLLGRDDREQSAAHGRGRAGVLAQGALAVPRRRKAAAISGRRQARPASDREPDRPGLRRQPFQEAVEGARRGPRLRLRAPAHDARTRSSRSCRSRSTLISRPTSRGPRRCYELGQAIRKAVQSATGERARRHPRLRRPEPFHRRRGTRPRRARRAQAQ